MIQTKLAFEKDLTSTKGQGILKRYKKKHLMTTKKPQHQLRLPVDFEPAFQYVVQKLMKENESLNKNTIMVQAIEVMVMNELRKEFSVEEATQFLNGITPDVVKPPTKLDWRPI